MRVSRLAIDLEIIKFHLVALVHKLLTPSEVRGNESAETAITKEKDKLVERGTWSEDPKDVREWSSVAREARLEGKVVHTAIVFPICSIKNSELPDSDPRRIHKGRIVLGGDNIRDQGVNGRYSTRSHRPRQLGKPSRSWTSWVYSPVGKLKTPTRSQLSTSQFTKDHLFGSGYRRSFDQLLGQVSSRTL